MYNIMKLKFFSFLWVASLLIPFVAMASGMNRVVLKPNNTVGNKNLLKQEMFYKVEGNVAKPCTNTIFVIQNDFELAENITIPADCILEFDGGSLRNGIINTNGCYIDAGLYQVFDNIKFNTVYSYDGELEVVDNIYIKVLSGNSFINRKTNTIIASNSIVNRRYTYRITGKNTNLKTEGQSVSISLNGQKYFIADITPDNSYKLRYDYTRIIGIDNSTGGMVSGIVKSLKGITFYSISPLSFDNNSIVKNKEIHPEWFGAKGDNVNDDSYAFNTALDLAYYSDSKVVIGNGVYRIDDALVIHTHTNLEGVVPAVEHPVKGCFSVNTDVGLLIFDRYNPSGSYILDNLGFIPFSDKYNYNYVGIKIYHSQNHARISNVGVLNPSVGIDVDAIGGVQTLRCEDVSVWCHENNGSIAMCAKNRLGGWFNANYVRLSRTSHCGGIKFEGGEDNILEGGAVETNTGEYYLIDLDKEATLIARGLDNENGKSASLRNSSTLKIEGDSYLIGPFDCDETSYVIYTSHNVQTRQSIINNSVVYNDVVLAHYRVFPKKPSLWYETINNRIVKPLDLGDNYQPHKYNGRVYTSGKCKIPMGSVDINGKTIVLRIISPSAFKSMQRSNILALNENVIGKTMLFSQGRSVSLNNSSILYGPYELNLGAIEKGERFIFIPSKQEEYILQNVTMDGNPSFMISDIYIIDKDIKDIIGNEKLRIIDILNSLDSYIQDDGFLLGYNKGATKDRPTDLMKKDEGFEYFDTTLHKPIYWAGDLSVGDNGWVDAMGRYPNP